MKKEKWGLPLLQRKEDEGWGYSRALWTVKKIERRIRWGRNNVGFTKEASRFFFYGK